MGGNPARPARSEAGKGTTQAGALEAHVYPPLERPSGGFGGATGGQLTARQVEGARTAHSGQVMNGKDHGIYGGALVAAVSRSGSDPVEAMTLPWRWSLFAADSLHSRRWRHLGG